MAHIISAERVDADTVRVTVEGVADVSGTEYPWSLELTAPRALFFNGNGDRRTKAATLSLLTTHIWDDLAG